MAQWVLLCSLLVAGLAGMLYTDRASSATDFLLQALGFGPAKLSSISEPLLDPQLPTESWNIIHRLGGLGPWISKTVNIIEGSIEPPTGCQVDQVHMIARHTERYPTFGTGVRMLELYHRIADSGQKLNGSLDFVNNWSFFTDDPSNHFEQLISAGPYAGTLSAFAAGVNLRTRYMRLIRQAIGQDKTSIWASDSQRVIDTAKYFSAGFYGVDWQRAAKLHIISEDASLGADTLTPGDTCLNYARNVDDYGREYGAKRHAEFKGTYLGKISERFAGENPQFSFAEDEIYTMQEICAFETMTSGQSDWCNVFTSEEWDAFQYARDVMSFYRSGPGNKYGATMGWLWVNATANILRAGPEAGPLFFSFAHDGDLVRILAALELFPQDPDLPTSYIMSNRTWQMSDVVPMGGRVVLERLTCQAPQECWSNAPFYPNHVYCSPKEYHHFVRVNINDGIVGLPGCDSGPGSSCPLNEFLNKVEQRGTELGTFGSVCGLADDAAKQITFLHQ